MNKDLTESQPAEKEWQHIFDSISDGLIIQDLETGLIMNANPAACTMHGCPREEFIGLSLISFIHPDSQYAFSEYIQALQSDSVMDVRTLHLRREGSTFYGEWRGKLFRHQGRLCLLGILRDVSERIRLEEFILQRSEAHTHEQATLLEISHTLASTLELQPGLILDQLRQIIEYTQGALFIVKDSTLIASAMRGEQHLEHLMPIQIPVNDPATLVTLFNGHRPIRIADVWSDAPEAKFLRTLLNDGAVMLLEETQAWMWVPLAVRGRIIGGVALAHEQPNYFTPHHAGLALSVANQAAITMINAELYEHAQEVAVLEERQRLARNLHDAVNQSLFSAGLIAEVLPRLWEQDQEEARNSLGDLRRLTRGAMAEMRALLAELRPSTITDSDLGDLLHLLGDALSGRANVPVTVTVAGEFILPVIVQVAFYRICQEALNNVAKHAKAGKVEINLKQEGNLIELRVHDDGQGFDPKEILSGHYGLSMMRERAEAAGLLLSIISQPGHGTELTVHWTQQNPS